MKSPGILNGLVIAFVISLGAGVTSLLLGGFVGKGALFNIILLAAVLTYLVYLLRRSPAKVGRVVVFCGWAVISLGCWLLQVPLFEQILLQAGLVWLVRSLYFHSSLFSAVLDFGLVSVGLAASAWAMLNTGSIAASLWSFFLVQALFCWIPDLARRQSGKPESDDPQAAAFESAHRVAVDAVRKLSQT